jgi:hypothetical protein
MKAMGMRRSDNREFKTAEQLVPRQGLLEVCSRGPGWAAALTMPCAGTAPVHWLPSPPLRLSLQAI